MRLARRRGRLRRPASIVAPLIVGALALSACQSSPTVAAYVGAAKITEKQVDQMVADAEAKAKGQPGIRVPSRSQVVTTLVLNEACQQERVGGQATPDTVTPEQITQYEGGPVGSTYTAVRAKAWSCVGALTATDTSMPTEAELRDVYQHVIAAGLNESYDNFLLEATSSPQIKGKVQIAREVSRLVEQERVTVNPRYRPLEFGLLMLETGAPIVVARLGQKPAVPVAEHS